MFELIVVLTMVCIGLAGAFFLECFPYVLKVAGQIAKMSVFTSGLQSFITLFSRVFLFLLSPVTAYAIEADLLDVKDVSMLFVLAYSASLIVLLFLIVNLNAIIEFTARYIITASSEGNYIVCKKIPHHEVNMPLHLHGTNRDFHYKFYLYNIFSSIFSISIVPLILLCALIYSDFRLTIYTLSPLITMSGTFVNQYYIERTLVISIQKSEDIYSISKEFFYGRLTGLVITMVLFVLISFTIV